MKKNIIFIIMLLFSLSAFADSPTSAIETIQQSFLGETGQWNSNLVGVVKRLFIILSVISGTWLLIGMALRGADLPDIMKELVTFIMITGLWFFIIDHAYEIIKLVIDSFTQASSIATGRNFDLSPTSIMDAGLELAEKIIDDSGFFDVVIYGLMGLIVTFIYFYLAVLVLFALIESHIVAGAGIIVLGFSGSPWTSDIAKKYLIFALSVGLKMFFTFLIAGLGIKLVEDIVKNTGLGDVRTIFAIIGVLFMIAYLAQKIPTLAQSVFNGASSGNAPDMRGMAASVAKAGAAAALAVAGAGATVAAAHHAAKENIGDSATLDAASTSTGTEKMSGEGGDNDASAIPNALSGGSASKGGASNGETSSGGASSGGASSDGASSGGASSGGASSGGASSGDASSGGASSGGASSGDASSGGASSGGASSDGAGAPSDGAPSDGAPSDGAPNGEISAVESPNGEASNASRLAKGLNYARAFGAAYAKGAAATTFNRLSKSHHFDNARNIRKQTLSKKIKDAGEGSKE